MMKMGRILVLVETETLNKVICETEFRDSCETRVERVCRNVTSGVVECRQVDTATCVDSMTNKCGVEAVLKNVSYTETVCNMVATDICEMEPVGGESVPVPGSCVTKQVEECGPHTRFVEEFVNEEVCRDIPIKDCRTVPEEECSEQVETVCEDLNTETCDIVPHEECRQVVDKVPVKVSKKVTKVVCDDKEEMVEANDDAEEEDVPSIQDILEIFGVTVNENDVNIDDTFINESSTTTTRSTSTTTKSSTTTTRSTTTTTPTSTTRKSSTISPEFGTTTAAAERRADGSKIIFSDAAIDNRNKDLATRVYIGRVSTTTRPNIVRAHLPNSQIFFPE